jgi:hypothetical protein
LQNAANGVPRVKGGDHKKIDPDSYCETPSTFDYDVIFPPRSEPDDKAGLPLGEEMAEGGYLLGTATQEKPEPHLSRRDRSQGAIPS